MIVSPASVELKFTVLPVVLVNVPEFVQLPPTFNTFTFDAVRVLPLVMVTFPDTVSVGSFALRSTETGFVPHTLSVVAETDDPPRTSYVGVPAAAGARYSAA